MMRLLQVEETYGLNFVSGCGASWLLFRLQRHGGLNSYGTSMLCSLASASNLAVLGGSGLLLQTNLTSNRGVVCLALVMDAFVGCLQACFLRPLAMGLSKCCVRGVSVILICLVWR